MIKVISIDMGTISSITTDSQTHANRLLRFLALQKPGDISQEKMGSYLGTSKGNVRNILNILEKTQLIFHCEPYIASAKRSIIMGVLLCSIKYQACPDIISRQLEFK